MSGGYEKTFALRKSLQMWSSAPDLHKDRSVAVSAQVGEELRKPPALTDQLLVVNKYCRQECHSLL